MKILIMTSQFSHGGLETHILTYANELKRRGHQVKIMFEDSLSPSEYVSQIKEFALPLRAFPKSKTGNLNQVVKTIEWQINGFKPDIIHLHPFESLFYGSLLAHRFKVPFVCSLHGILSFTYITNHIHGKRLLKEAGHLFVVSEKMINRLVEIGVEKNRITFLPNAVEVNEEEQTRIRKMPKKIAVVSRLDSDKYDSITNFFRLFCSTNYYWKHKEKIIFDIYGIGVENDRLKKDLFLLGISNITFKGFVGEMNKLNFDYDMVVGMGRVILEAGAHSIPALVTGNTGVGGFITKKNYFDYRKTNFTLPEHLPLIHSGIEFEQELKKIKTKEVDIYPLVKEHNNIRIIINNYLNVLVKLRMRALFNLI